jgi:hypothetical protein
MASQIFSDTPRFGKPSLPCGVRKSDVLHTDALPALIAINLQVAHVRQDATTPRIVSVTIPGLFFQVAS